MLTRKQHLTDTLYSWLHIGHNGSSRLGILGKLWELVNVPWPFEDQLDS